jgi:hypothetical protein
MFAASKKVGKILVVCAIKWHTSDSRLANLNYLIFVCQLMLSTRLKKKSYEIHFTFLQIIKSILGNTRNRTSTIIFTLKIAIQFKTP